MTKEDAVAQLKALAGSDDPEVAHSHADSILLKLIDDPEVTKAFDAIEKWYA